ncbi:MAG TPA: NYN domain-containing protein [Thermoanaerobaculia bacterium]
MRVLVDGSNLLGAMRLERESDGAKRELLRLLASWARRRKAKIVCFFDGYRPDAFATALGAVSARFTHPRAADDAIVEEIEKLAREAFRLVTSDAALAARCRGRRVEIVDARAFARELEQAEPGSDEPSAGEWEAYFSDPKNRNI